MRKKTAIILSVLMILALALVGCGVDNNSGQNAASSDQESNGQEGEGSQQVDGDVDHVVVTFIYLTNPPDDLQMVQDAVNEITIPDINVEVEFKPISIGEVDSTYPLWISSGEQVDVMCLLGQDIKNFTSAGLIEPLNDLLTPETAPTILSLAEEFPVYKSVGEEIYGIQPVGINYGHLPGIAVREEWLNEIEIEEKDTYTFDDVTEILAAFKENHPDVYPFYPEVGRVKDVSAIDLLGGMELAGIVNSEDSEMVLNYFESEEYKTYIAQLAKWYEAGYILPDIATSELSLGELKLNGKVAAYAIHLAPEMIGTDNEGMLMAGIPLEEIRLGAVDTYTYFTVPITAVSPEASVRLIDYIWKNHDLSNLIWVGIEGVHYEMVDKENNLIKLPDGVDASNNPYINIFGVWGDRRYEYSTNASATRAEHDEYTNKALEHKWKSYGFSFDSTPVSNQIVACQSVLDQYQRALETGSLGAEWEETYNTMLGQLKSAGIDDIVAECQKQFDTFLGK